MYFILPALQVKFLWGKRELWKPGSSSLGSINSFKSSTMAKAAERSQGMLNPSSSWCFPFPWIRQNLHMHPLCPEHWFGDLHTTGQKDFSVSGVSCHSKNWAQNWAVRGLLDTCIQFWMFSVHHYRISVQSPVGSQCCFRGSRVGRLLWGLTGEGHTQKRALKELLESFGRALLNSTLVGNGNGHRAPALTLLQFYTHCKPLGWGQNTDSAGWELNRVPQWDRIILFEPSSCHSRHTQVRWAQAGHRQWQGQEKENAVAHLGWILLQNHCNS